MRLVPLQIGPDIVAYRFWCPACQHTHKFAVAGPPPTWNFNGDTDRPTFLPSLRMIGGNQCHLVLTAGRIHYCGDSQHALAGKIIELPEIFMDRNGRIKPMDSLHTLNGKPLPEKDAEKPPIEKPKKADRHPSGVPKTIHHFGEDGEPVYDE